MEILIKLSIYVLAMSHRILVPRFPKIEFYIVSNSKLRNEEDILLAGWLSRPKAKVKNHEVQEQKVQEQKVQEQEVQVQ